MSDNPPSIKNQPNTTERGVFCPQCGAPIHSTREDTIFCNKCGEKVPENIRLRLPSRLTSSPPAQPILPTKFVDPYPPINFKKKRKWNIWAAIFLPLITYFIINIITVIIIVIDMLLAGDLNSYEISPTIIFISSSFSIFFLMAPLIWVNRYHREKLSFKERMKDIGFPLDKYPPFKLTREILIGIALGLLGMIIVTGLQYGSFYLFDWIFKGNLSNELDRGALDSFGIEIPTNLLGIILLVFTMVVFVGIPEEAMFRGFVQRSFESKLSRPAALFITAVYFSIYHIYIFILKPEVFLFLFVPYLGLSIIMGLIRNWRKDLFAVSVMHIVYNSLQLVVLYIIYS